MFNYHDMLSLLTHILIRRATSIVVVRQRILIASESFFFLISSATRLYNYLPVYGVNTYLAGSRKSVTTGSDLSFVATHGCISDVSLTSLGRLAGIPLEGDYRQRSLYRVASHHYSYIIKRQNLADPSQKTLVYLGNL